MSFLTIRCALLASLLCAIPLLTLCDQPLGTITGKVVDTSGAAIAGAKVTLVRDDGSTPQQALSGNDGQFAFPNSAAGSFRLTVAAPNLTPQTASGILTPGEAFTLVPIVLPVATLNTDVEVTLTQVELAEVEIKAEEKQRLLGVVPNYLVSYLPDAQPLIAKQKFELAWKTLIDPFSFGFTAIIAGVQQAENSFSGYGQGAAGYGKRYGADYADFLSGTIIGSALLPALLRQDPRYFVKGSGSRKSRLLYAIENTVIRRGDNRKWQPNYSDIFGALAAGGISNLYYPAKNRDGLSLTFQNALIGLGAGALGNIAQEFLFKRLTPASKAPPPPARN